MDSLDASHHRFCLIIGAGASGVIQAGELLRKNILQFHHFQILERNDGYGGVWKQATYPGAACDVWSHVYQISWFPNPNWLARFAMRKEIAEYYDHVADSYNLRKVTSFNENVLEARWSDETMLWTVISENTKTKEATRWTANVVVHATGLFNRAKPPSIPGISDFKGEIWHTMDWPVDVKLEGKRVAIIGTGPSAVQVIPSIQPIVKSLTVYQRSPGHCIPRDDFQFSPFIKSLFKHLPFIHYLYCFVLFYTMEILAYLIFRPDNKAFAGNMIKTATQHLHNQVKDPVLRGKLQPKIPFGCKRILISDVYYPTFEKANVDLITDPVIKITSSGIISKPVSLINDSELSLAKKEGKDEDTAIKPELYTAANDKDSCERSVDVDVIIWGTGFQVQKPGGVYKVIGRSGQTLEQHWQEECNSLYGVATHDFPNFLILFGPNGISLWTSLIHIFELQARYNALVIEALKTRNADGDKFAIMPKADVEKQYTESLQPELSKLATSWDYGCRSYYTNSKGRNTILFPWRQSVYKKLVQKIEWKNYVVLEKEVGGKREKAEKRKPHLE